MVLVVVVLRLVVRLFVLYLHRGFVCLMECPLRIRGLGDRPCGLYYTGSLRSPRPIPIGPRFSLRS